MGRSAPIPSWKSAQMAMVKLREDKNWRDLLIFAIGCGTAFRVSDYHTLKWSQLENMCSLTIAEQKTAHLRKSARTVHLGDEIIAIIKECKEHMNPGTIDRFVFRPRRSKTSMSAPITDTGINVALRIVQKRYPECGLPEGISSHSLRKCFGLHGYEMMGKTDYALEFMSMLFEHRDTRTTRVYLGLDKDAAKKYYQSLKFDLGI